MPPRSPASPDTSKVQTAGIFRVFTTSAKTGVGEKEGFKRVWVIFRTLSITAVQWLLCRRQGEAVAPASFPDASRAQTASELLQRRPGEDKPPPCIPLCHNNSSNFGGRGGGGGGGGEERVVYCSGFWTVSAFSGSDTHPGANPGKESALVIIALIPEPNAQHLIFSPFPKHEKPPPHPLSIFIPTESHIQNEGL